MTKSGGNRFTGEGHYYYLGSGLSAGPVQRLVLSPVDDSTVFTVQDEKQPNHRNEIGGIARRPDRSRPALLLRINLAALRDDERTSTRSASGTDPGEIKREQTIMNAYGKVSYGGRRVNAYFGALLTPTTSEGTLPAYNGIGPQILSSIKVSQRGRTATRGYEIDQRNFTGNVDITLTNTTFLSVKVGHFYDNYKDTGVP